MMRKRTLVVGYVLVMLVSIFLVGCAPAATPAEPAHTERQNAADVERAFKIGFISSNLNDTGQVMIADAVKEYADENRLELIVHDAQEDVVRQQDQVKALIELNVDAIVVVPVDTGAMVPITEMVIEAEIPLIYVNRNPFSGAVPEGVYYVGSQEIVAGRLQGEELVKVMGETGNVAILMGILGNEGAVKRTEGNIEVLGRYPGIEVLATETGNWQRDQGLTITENWLIAHGEELDAILANNDEMALGAIQALKAAGRDDVIVMGVDATPDAIAAVVDGTLAATIFQDLKGQGRTAMEMAHNVLLGEAQEQIVWIDFLPVTPENVSEYQ